MQSHYAQLTVRTLCRKKMHLYEKCNFEGVRAGNMKLHSRRNVIPTRKMGKGLFIPQEIMGGLGNRGMQDFFVNLFSPAAK